MISGQKTPERGVVGKGDVLMKLSVGNDWPQLLLQRKLNSRGTGELVLDKCLYQFSGLTACGNVYAWVSQKSVNGFLSQPAQQGVSVYVAQPKREYKNWITDKMNFEQRKGLEQALTLIFLPNTRGCSASWQRACEGQ